MGYKHININDFNEINLTNAQSIIKVEDTQNTNIYKVSYYDISNETWIQCINVNINPEEINKVITVNNQIVY